MKMTSAYANKLLKSLADEKSYWEAKEATSRTYVAAVGEEPVIPEYDYSAVSETLKEIDRKTVIIKHALNLANATANERRQHSGKDGTAQLPQSDPGHHAEMPSENEGIFPCIQLQKCRS